jgi:hypothetical protein
MRVTRSAFLGLVPILMLTFADPASGRGDRTITGSPMSDDLVGTVGDDIICGFAGDDRAEDLFPVRSVGPPEHV